MYPVIPRFRAVAAGSQTFRFAIGDLYFFDLVQEKAVLAGIALRDRQIANVGMVWEYGNEHWKFADDAWDGLTGRCRAHHDKSAAGRCHLLERPNDFHLQRFIHLSNDREKYSDA